MSASSSNLAWSGRSCECLSKACACSKQRSRSPRPKAEAVLPVSSESREPRLRRSCLLGVWVEPPAPILQMQQGEAALGRPRAAAATGCLDAAAATGNAATRVARRPRSSRGTCANLALGEKTRGHGILDPPSPIFEVGARWSRAAGWVARTPPGAPARARRVQPWCNPRVSPSRIWRAGLQLPYSHGPRGDPSPTRARLGAAAGLPPGPPLERQHTSDSVRPPHRRLQRTRASCEEATLGQRRRGRRGRLSSHGLLLLAEERR